LQAQRVVKRALATGGPGASVLPNRTAMPAAKTVIERIAQLRQRLGK